MEVVTPERSRGNVKSTLGRKDNMDKGTETGKNMPCLRERKAAREPGV